MEAPPTTAFYTARPVIRVADREQTGLSDGLLSLLVEETTAGLFRCEATFGNWGATGSSVGFLYFDRQVLDFGKSFAVRIGAGEAAAEVFDGRISGLEGRYPQARPPEISVLAEDRLQDLRMSRRTRSFEDVSDADVFRSIAGEHGLQADLDLSGPTYRVLTQVNQSDLAFLRERARAIDAEVWVEGRTLHAQARARRSGGEVTLAYGQRLREFSVLADLATQRTAVTVNGWDVAAKSGIAHEVGPSVIQSELNGHVSGASVLQQAFGDRTERIVHMTPFSAQEAQHFAEAHFRRLARGFVRGQGVAEGDGRLRVGTRVRLQELGPLFDGAYTVVEVRHTFDGTDGFRTYFSVERPGLGQ